MTKQKFGAAALDFIIITLGALFVAAAVFFFMLPSNVAVGSISALSMVLHNFLPLPVSIISLLINAVLVVVGFLLVGAEFGTKTVYTSLMVPVFLGGFELAFPNFRSLTEDPFLDTLCYILIVGMAMAVLFSRNASSGGLDIVAKILNKYLKIELGRAGSAVGIAVALSSALCYDAKTVVLSVLGTYFSGGCASSRHVWMISCSLFCTSYTAVLRSTRLRAPTIIPRAARSLPSSTSTNTGG